MPPVLRRKGASGALTLPCVGLIGGLKKGAARAAAHGPTTMKRRQLRDTAGSLIDWLRSLRRPSKVLIVIGFDCGACILAMLLAIYLRVGYIPMASTPLVVATLVAMMISIPTLTMLGSYRAVFRHIGSAAILRLARASAFFAIPYSTIFTLWGIEGVPRTIGLLLPTILFLLLVAGRLVASEIFRGYGRIGRGPSGVLIQAPCMDGRQMACGPGERRRGK